MAVSSELSPVIKHHVLIVSCFVFFCVSPVLDIWKWIVIASVLMLVLLGVLIGVFIIRRRRARQMGFIPITTVSDSDFQLTKMVKEVVTKC